MKTMIKLPAILLGFFLFFAGSAEKVMAQSDEVSLQSFYDELSPYGVWINDPQYGYVWRPDVDQDDFRPYYSNGRWVMTEYGNTWVSNYDWGWAPFHYGRWVYNRYNQWVWIPDTVWGPAWVSWRSGNGYYGWAPLGPSISIGINIGRGGYRIPDMCWNFVPYSSIYYSSFPRYRYIQNRVYIQKTVIINNTYVRNNRTYYTGPRAEDIRRATNQSVTVYNIHNSSRPGATRIDNKTVNIYNPRPVRGASNANAAPRNAVQGSINRGPVGREGAVASRPARGAAMNDRGTTSGNATVQERANRGAERPQQGASGSRDIQQAPQRMERPQSAGREQALPQGAPQQMPQRDRGAALPQQAERPQADRTPVQQTMPQRAERPAAERTATERPQVERQQMERPQAQAIPQRMESRPQAQRTESQPQQAQRPQSQQRAERQQSAPQRVERTSSGSSQRSSGSSSRGNSSSSRESHGGGRVRGGE